MGLPRSHRFGSCLVPGGEEEGKVRGDGGLTSGLLGKNDGGGYSGKIEKKTSLLFSWFL